jgi:hypothetical protein
MSWPNGVSAAPHASAAQTKADEAVSFAIACAQREPECSAMRRTTSARMQVATGSRIRGPFGEVRCGPGA